MRAPVAERPPRRKEVAMPKGHSLQDPYLNTLRKERIPVSVYLVNGIKLQGQIESFDQFVVVLRNSVSQMVYKHAISTVVPSRNVRLPSAEPSAGEREEVAPRRKAISAGEREGLAVRRAGEREGIAPRNRGPVGEDND